MKNLALLALIPALAQAGPFWHPEAKSVVVADPEYATVCTWSSDGTSIGPVFQPGTWECESIETAGARLPITLDFLIAGPVKVYARWAYAVDAQDNLVPMQEGVME